MLAAREEEGVERENSKEDVGVFEAGKVLVYWKN